MIDCGTLLRRSHRTPILSGLGFSTHGSFNGLGVRVPSKVCTTFTARTKPSTGSHRPNLLLIRRLCILGSYLPYVHPRPPTRVLRAATLLTNPGDCGERRARSSGPQLQAGQGREARDFATIFNQALHARLFSLVGCSPDSADPAQEVHA